MVFSRITVSMISFLPEHSLEISSKHHKVSATSQPLSYSLVITAPYTDCLEDFITFHEVSPNFLVGGWTTHLKNRLVKLDHFPK